MNDNAISSELVSTNVVADPVDVPCRDPFTITTQPVKSATRCRITARQQKAQHRAIAKLTRRIHAGYARVQATFRDSVLHAKRAGEDLQELKALAGRGNWHNLLTELHEECGIAETTARLYMRIARNWQQIESSLGQAQLCDTSLRRVQQLLSKAPTLKPVDRRTARESAPISRATFTPDEITSQAIAESADEPLSVPAEWRDPDASIGLAPDHPSAGSISIGPTDTASEWLTPPEIVDAAIKAFSPDGITVDVAAEDTSERFNVPAELHYTQAIDGLAPDNAWTGSIFVNPPHGKIDDDKWVDRLALEVQSGAVDEGIIVLPARTDAPCFDTLVGLSASFVFLRARHDDPAPFPVMVAYVGHRHDQFALAVRKLGPVLRPAEATWSAR